VNKAGVSITVQAMNVPFISITYSCPLLNTNEEFIEKLSKRWFVTDTENPDIELPVKMGIMTVNATVNGITQPTTYGHSIIIEADSIKARFLLIGFKGISSIESEEAETHPLFFLVENNKEKSKALTPVPRLAEELFAVDYEPMFFSKQEYSGEILFEKSKNVALHLILSADLKTVEKMKLLAEKLYLLPLKQETWVSYMEISGGLEVTSSIDIIESKITLDDRPVICDLTVTNSCIYGTVKVEMDDCETKQVYAVFKNITTPREIPENILSK
jgi:hypothetical protein